ncbi:MAG: sulfite exporter TauE/SafE family protein [Silicimonas sp.]|nr:sulfite exporter TauE/SafE family protein [Silicimonas sp.]
MAAVVIGVAKGGLASAAALAVPFLAIFMNPVQAAALVLPVLLVTDLAAIWLYRRDFSTRNVLILLPAMFAGIAIATVIVPYTPEPALLAFTGAVGLWAVWRQWFGSRPQGLQKAEIVPGLLWGTVAGITTFITHSGAPPTQAYLMPQNLPRLIFAGTMSITFAIANFAKIPSYHALGYFDGLDWPLVGALAAIGLVSTFLGRWMVKTMSDRIYMRVIEALLLVLSVILLAKAGAAIL